MTASLLFRVLGALENDINCQEIASSDELPPSLHELYKDPRLKLCRIKVHSTYKDDHDEVCSKTECFSQLPILYFKITIRDFFPQHWGSTSTRGNYNIGDIVRKIIHFCPKETASESFLHLLRSPWLKDYDITNLLAYLPNNCRRQFYCFLTQRLIHISSARETKERDSTSRAAKWPCITFISGCGTEQLDGIYFLYQPVLDNGENIKASIFEPLLGYLSCLINQCPLIRESFGVYYNAQKHFGVFKQARHTHTVIDGHWKFSFSRKAYALLSSIERGRTDKLCSCYLCRNSSVEGTEVRFMYQDLKSKPI